MAAGLGNGFARVYVYFGYLHVVLIGWNQLRPAGIIPCQWYGFEPGPGASLTPNVFQVMIEKDKKCLAKGEGVLEA